MIFFFILCLSVFFWVRFGRRENNSVAFFHPYCDAGGGGERVLWEAISAISEKYPTRQIFIYTGDEPSSKEILSRAESRFNIKIENVTFIHLKYRWMVEASTWPSFTLAGQSAGSIFLAFEALLKLNPEIVIDSMGYSFTYPLFWLFGCKVGCYIHYPTISTDMLQKVSKREADFNNSETIANNSVLSSGKLLYYQHFSKIYAFCGNRSSVVMTNSSWTQNHLDQIWARKSAKIFPPCDVSAFTKLEIEQKRIPFQIMSLAQFRPEKNHKLQVEAFKQLYENPNLSSDRSKLSLIMAGGVRNPGDEARVEELQSLISAYGLEKAITIEKNISFERIVELFETSSCGIHTMKDEHFGITCVDFQASGTIAVGHDSAGPKEDIFVDYKGGPTGFLATDAKSFADSMEKILLLPSEKKIKIQENARNSCKRFSSEQFKTDFLYATAKLFK